VVAARSPRPEVFPPSFPLCRAAEPERRSGVRVAPVGRCAVWASVPRGWLRIIHPPPHSRQPRCLLVSPADVGRFRANPRVCLSVTTPRNAHRCATAIASVTHLRHSPHSNIYRLLTHPERRRSRRQVVPLLRTRGAAAFGRGSPPHPAHVAASGSWTQGQMLWLCKHKTLRYSACCRDTAQFL